jgi:hypothetical protein
MAKTSLQLKIQKPQIYLHKPAINFLSNLGFNLILIFFILMLVTPASNQFERGLVLLAILGGSTIFLSSWRIDKTILVWLLITTSVGLYSLVIGISENLTNALMHSTVYLVWPIIFVYFIGFAIKPDMIISFIKAIIIGVFLSSFMGLLLVTLSLFGLSSSLLDNFFENQGGRTGLHDGYIKYHLYNVATLIYGFAFMYVVVADSMLEKWVTMRWRLFIYMTTVLVFLAVLISGRRGAWVIVLITPVVHLMISRFVGHKTSFSRMVFPFVAFVPFFLLAVLLFDLDISALLVVFQTIMEFEQDVSNIARAEQMDSLLAGWVESPFLGNGLGTSSSILRNEDLPWAYELSYLALIFHTGLLGLVIYVSAISWIFAASARLMIAHNMSKPMFLPLLTGLACFLIANATNPYLSTFDYLWTIFLPLAAVNAFRVGRISIS